jgi:hypothetical protein
LVLIHHHGPRGDLLPATEPVRQKFGIKVVVLKVDEWFDV